MFVCLLTPNMCSPLSLGVNERGGCTDVGCWSFDFRFVIALSACSTASYTSGQFSSSATRLSVKCTKPVAIAYIKIKNRVYLIHIQTWVEKKICVVRKCRSGQCEWFAITSDTACFIWSTIEWRWMLNHVTRMISRENGRLWLSELYMVDWCWAKLNYGRCGFPVFKID